MSAAIFKGMMPALMTPCGADRRPDFDALVAKAASLMDTGMSAVIYCGSMGDWPLVSDTDRMEGVARLTAAGIPVVVGTGAINSAAATALAAHAQSVGAAGLMVIPRVLSRGPSATAQKHHFKSILGAAPDIPAVIYNSPFYGFSTRAELFFALRQEHSNLVGFKEFGGAEDLSYAAENITSHDDGVTLMVGVDTQVYHGIVNCGASGAITGVGNALPHEVLMLERLCQKAACGDAEARLRAQELTDAIHVVSTFDEGPDLVLFYKHMLVMQGESAFEQHFNETDVLTPAQRGFCEAQFHLFKAWFADWSKQGGIIDQCR